jgi:hypothetical protein
LRKLSSGAESVVDARGDIAVFGQGGAEFNFSGLAFVSFLPSSTVNQKDSGGLFASVTVLGEVEVEFFSTIGFKKGDIAPNFHLGI